MERNTKLTRPELTAKANGWILGNQERWAQIQSTTKYPYQYLGKILQSMYGIPVWRESRSDKSITGKLPTKKDLGVLFRLEDAGNGRVKFKSVPTRRATRGGPTGTSSGTRRFTERITSPNGTDFADSERRMGEANSRGMDGGHITPLGRQQNGQELAVQRGRTVQQYQKQFTSNGLSIGHTRENIEDQTPKNNRRAQPFEYSQLDNNLRALEIKNGARQPTPRPKRKRKPTADIIESTTRPSLTIRNVPVPRVGTLQGGGYRIDLDPITGASMMIP